jgi:spore coat protein A
LSSGAILRIPRRARWRRAAVALVLIVVAAGYGAVGRPAGASTGMTLGHVPDAAAPTSATIVIGPGAAYHGYSTKVVTISRGGTLKVVNQDSISHTVTAVAHNGRGLPLFDTVAGPGTTSTIPAASRLAAGHYTFYCRFHPGMRGELVVEGGSGGTRPVPVSFDQPLRLPKVLTGATIRITVRKADVQVLPGGPKTPMWTYDGTYPGPTIRRPAGHDTKVTFVNLLPKSAGSITVHLHGDHHSSANDGQPDSYLIPRGGQRTYDYPLTNGGRPEPAAFDFYHDHRMNETGRNNWNGLQGMFITDDKTEASLGLPTGRYDVPLLVSDRSFTADNHLVEPFPPNSPPGDETVGNRILVDGRVSPYLDVATHRYRFRLLNASNFESYDFALSDGQSMVQIGTGNLLPKPVVRRDILLGPAQRADVIVDFAGELGHNIVLRSIARTNQTPSGIATPTAPIMQFRVTQKVTDHSRLPSTLEKTPAINAPTKPSFTWTFALGGNAKTGTYWTVNGKPFDPKRVDVEVPLGSTQTWQLRNVSPITHYIHLHEEEWHTLSRDGRKPPPWERGLEDTWRLDPGETVVVAARFTDYTGVFMVHCHMLDHEDDGMMAQFAVVKMPGAALPAGYFLDASRNPAPPARDLSMSMSMPTSIANARPPSPPWSRLIIRSLHAGVIELLAVGMLVGYRRYRRYRRYR